MSALEPIAASGRPVTRAALPCFKSYDVRGRIGTDLDSAIARRIGHAFGRVMSPDTVVVGRDCRESSAELQSAVINGLRSAGVNVIDIGLAGTEEVYFATAHFGAGGGIEVTASHNPIDYNGMKMVGPDSRPLSEEEFDAVHRAAMVEATDAPVRGFLREDSAREAYARHVVSMIDVSRLRPMKILTNAGNGVAGAAFDAIAAELARQGAPLEFVCIDHAPDGSFPNGIPNPLLPENRSKTALPVIENWADFGIAWDGDFDRCFFFDENGSFIDGEYVVALLAAACLSDEPGARIVHDPRVVWNTHETIARAGGQAVQSRTGHAFVKQKMRESQAVYGGEMSAHHYFRDFMFCDSGMIPWLKVAALISDQGKGLAELVRQMRTDFPSSGEVNFRVWDVAEALAHIFQHVAESAVEVDWTDGLSVSFPDWRFNLRGSSTEPLLRLNVEARGSQSLVRAKVEMINDLLREHRVDG